MATTSVLRCLLESGVWVDPGEATTVARCCAACVGDPACDVFQIVQGHCALDSRNASAAVLGAVLRVAVTSTADWVASSATQQRHARRRLRQKARRKKKKEAAARLSALCSTWQPFSNATMAERCAAAEHPQRFVLTECGSEPLPSAELAAAQASFLFLRADCAASCVYHPMTPTAAGWMYRSAHGCFERWSSTGSPTPRHPCVVALMDSPDELTRIIGHVSRACPLRRDCHLPHPVSSAALHASGCSPRHEHRNESYVCGTVIDAQPSVSVDVVRAQVNGMWTSCRSPCLYSPVTPAAAGWSHDPLARCFRPFRRVYDPRAASVEALQHGILRPTAALLSPPPPVPQHPCLSPRRTAGVERMVRTASATCAECGEPQRRESCHELVRRFLSAARASIAAAPAPLPSTWDYDRVQKLLASRGSCRMPCNAVTWSHKGGVGGGSGSSGRGGGGGGDGRGGGGGGGGGGSSVDDGGHSGADGDGDGDGDGNGMGEGGQRWTSAQPVWLDAMRLSWASQGTRAAILKEWVALVRRRLDLGASRASSCAGRLLQHRSVRSQSFIELTGAREQMHKNKFVVLDALYISHILGRALVEPHVSDSRLGHDRPQQTSAVTSTVTSKTERGVRRGRAQHQHGGGRGDRRRRQSVESSRRLAEGTNEGGGGNDVAGGGPGSDSDGTDQDGDESSSAVGASNSEAVVRSDGEAAEEEAEESAHRAAQAAQAASSKAMADADVDGARQFSGLVLRHYWDLEPLCERFDLVPRSLYNKLRRGGHVVIAPRSTNRGIGRWRLHSKQAVLRAFRPVMSSRTIEIRGMWRSVTNREALRDSSTLPYQRMGLKPSVWELNPGYELIALQLIGGLMDPAAGGRFLAVQWRSEDWHKQLKGVDSSSPTALQDCAHWAAARVLTFMAKHNLSEAYLATDLRGGASGTYATGVAQAEALRILHTSVPRLQNPRLREFIDAIPDAGVRANVETAVCLKATAMLATTGSCFNCAHARRCAKMSSAFGHYIVERRRAFLRPTDPLF